ncbi:MAG TPA: hypothetical protein VHS31_15850 [Tepidisphaeraceae bacterium]|jgi:hypothetical protein|nr:hypothetical protein [Tepidisphaeraceae bacterium]
MWGNTVGWFIALVMLCILIFAMHMLNQIGQISEPTSFGKDQTNLGVVQLPTPPQKLVEMDENFDARAIYRSAIADYEANRYVYERYAEAGNPIDAKLPGLKDLVDATHAQTAKIFADDAGDIVRYDDKPALDALVKIGHLATRAALMVQADNPKEAQALFEGEFSLGAKLYDERLTVEEFSSGLELMSESAAGMTRLLRKTDQVDRATQFHDFDEQRKRYYNEHVLPVLKVLQSIDAQVVSEHAGDIFYFARNSNERMYRVEAIFMLGRLKYFVGDDGRIGDQRGAMQELKRLSQSPDPVIRQAASEARDLTIEQYRGLR